MPARPARNMGVPLVLGVPLLGSIDGGLTIVSHANAMTAVIVIVGPLAICALLSCLLVIVYRKGLRDYVNADPERRQAIREYNADMVSNVVSILRLVPIRPVALSSREGRRSRRRAAVPRQRQPDRVATKPTGRTIASIK